MIRTVSLETAKLLKENGFRQDAFFHYYFCPEGVPETQSTEYEWKISAVCGVDSLDDEIAAPTSDELLEELPDFLNCEALMYWKKMWRGEMCYFAEISLINRKKESKTFSGKSMPEAMAQMWLYLKREGLLKDKI